MSRNLNFLYFTNLHDFFGRVMFVTHYIYTVYIFEDALSFSKQKEQEGEWPSQGSERENDESKGEYQVD